MRRIVLQTPEEIGAAIARDIARRMAAAPGDRRFLLGCPGGRSARPIYAALARERLDLPRLVIVMMDEYLRESGTGLAWVPASAHFSCRRFAHCEIAGVLNDGRDSACHLPPRNIWLPEPDDAAAYDARIAAHGGVDFFVLACGAGDGHVAFNPPGSTRGSRTRIVTLAEQTRRDNMATFPRFVSLDDVPRYGVTVGIGTIAEQSRAAAMIVWGADKRLAWRRLTQARDYEPDWPATVIAACPDAALYADRAAGAD